MVQLLSEHSTSFVDTTISRLNGPTLIMIADGWTRRVFHGMLSRGELPEISDGLVRPGGLIDVVSNLPTVSLASHTTILTSSHQSEHRVVGHRWLEVEAGRMHDYLGRRGPRLANSDVSPTVPTIFETANSSFAVQSVISRGATKTLRLPTMRSGPLLRATTGIMLRNPEATVVTWLPRVDALAHTYGPDSRQVEHDMRSTSRSIGRLLTRLETAGLLDAAKLLLIPDHGLRAVRYSADLRKALKVAGLESTVNTTPKPKRALVLTSGDSSAMVYLPSQQKARLEDVAVSLAKRAAVQLVCLPEGGQLTVFSADGCSRARFRGASAEYSLLSGLDPLCLLNGSDSAHFDLARPLLRGPYPDFLHQMWRSYSAGRTGDLVVFAAEGFHFGKAPRLAWRLGYHRGSHGGAFEDELLVTAAHRGFGEVFRGIDVVRSADLLRLVGLMPYRTGVGNYFGGQLM